MIPFASTPTARRALAAALLSAALLSGCGNSSASGLDFRTPAPETTDTRDAVSAPSPSQAPTSAAVATAAAVPTPTLAPPPTAAPVTDEQKILAAYNAFYDQLGPISTMPATERPAALAKLTVDPLYSATLQEFAKRDAAGKVVYGKLIVNPVVALLAGDNAALEDCQDASKTGLMNRADGHKLTVGVKEFKRLSEMQRGADGVWRLSKIEHTQEAKC